MGSAGGNSDTPSLQVDRCGDVLLNFTALHSSGHRHEHTGKCLCYANAVAWHTLGSCYLHTLRRHLFADQVLCFQHDA